jgi:hypothetical protein
MKDYIVKIREVLEREIIVKAESEDDAERIATEMYNEEKVVLDYNDMIENDIETMGTWR